MTGVLIGSSLLIVIVAALRALLRGKVSARLIYALWGVVLLRLLVPFSLDWKLPSAEGAARTAYERTELSEAMLPYDSVSAPYAAGYSRSVLPENDPIQPYLDAGEAAPEYRVELHNEGTPEAETEFVFLRPWTEVLSSYLRPVWLIGTLAALVLLAYTNLSFYAKLRRTRRPIGSTEAGLPAYETDAIASPCLFGLFRPAIYVRAEDAGRLRHVLAHEDCHFRHLDHIWALLRAACLAVYWWDPLVWLAAALSRTDCELACDEAALSRLGEAERIPYGETLITMAAKPRPGELLRASSPIGSGKRELKARILAIARRGKRLLVPAVLAVCLCLFCAACAFTGGIAEPAEDLPTASDGIGDVSTLPIEDWDVQAGRSTFLLAGVDDAGAVDAIIVGAFDSGEGALTVVSIPRDTLVSVSGEEKRVLLLYNEGGADGLRAAVEGMLGFELDCFIVAGISALAELVDTVGGVEFDVPMDMHYSDPEGGVDIDLKAGIQRLDGKQTLDVLRYRSGYDSGDFGRIETQQALLGAVMEQFLSLGNIPQLVEAAEILSGSMTTDLSTEAAIALAGQLLLCKNLSIFTMPVIVSDGEAGLRVDTAAWLELVSEHLNPAGGPSLARPDGSGWADMGEYFGSRAAETGAGEVLDTDIDSEKLGEIENLAPDGTLEAWSYSIYGKLGADRAEVLLGSGQQYREGGWYCFEPNRLVYALRYSDGSYEVLKDQPLNDLLASYSGNAAKAMWDWYVTTNQLDYPLCLVDWTELLTGGDKAPGNFPAERCDAMGWYVYVPTTGWTLTTSSSAWIWNSEYVPDAYFAVRHESVAESTAPPTDGYSDSKSVDDDTGTWYVSYYCPEGQNAPDYAASVPESLKLMFNSFKLDIGFLPSALSLSYKSCGWGVDIPEVGWTLDTDGSSYWSWVEDTGSGARFEMRIMGIDEYEAWVADSFGNSVPVNGGLYRTEDGWRACSWCSQTYAGQERGFVWTGEWPMLPGEGESCEYSDIFTSFTPNPYIVPSK